MTACPTGMSQRPGPDARRGRVDIPATDELPRPGPPSPVQVLCTSEQSPSNALEQQVLATADPDARGPVVASRVRRVRILECPGDAP